MLFNSYPFVFAFLPAVLVGFYALRSQRWRLVFLIAASYYFYAYAKWWFPALMLGSTAISFTVGRVLDGMEPGRRRKLVLAVGVFAALALLGYFKYAEFVAGYASSLVGTITGTGLPTLDEFAKGIFLPAGISFYTFESVSYMVDVHRGDARAERNPLRYALFISFFPHLIAGPIVRYRQLQPQLERFHRFSADGFRAGMLLFGLGLAKKVLIADGIAFRIDPVLADPARLGFVDAWMALFAYAFQIYFDFSGYTDMALGLARMFGIELPWNFDRPYRAASPAEFWRRWHVTLSTWLRDYLYIPLGGNRKGAIRRDANLFATMALGGLWHGAALNFVGWGAYHGTMLFGHRRLERLPWRPPRAVAVVLTFLLVTVGWVFFRLHTMSQIGDTLLAMAGANGRGQVLQTVAPYLLIGGVMMWGLPEERTWSLAGWGYPRLTIAAVAIAAAVVSMNATQAFLYFKF